ncbi:MAG: hypothetical protein SOZ00_00975 [Tidjanibacter sp.]|nr:hypothetical protein [Tidjanibacter sp.]
MVIPVKIAAVLQKSTVPMLFGIRHNDSLRLGIQIYSSQTECVAAFNEGRADIALVSLHDAADAAEYQLLSDFCIAPAPKSPTILVDEWGDSPVAAVWIARQGLLPETVDTFEQALTFGVERVWEAILEQGLENEPDIYDFYTEKIDYMFDAKKHKAAEAYWKNLKKAVSHANPG